ncbi:MAG: hypothetical protein ACI8TP_000850 [Acidimicrobiales bacterium]|jgi:hypothetical protein
MPELDHLIFASGDLDRGIARITELTGAEAVFGGPHVGLGTRNALLTFDERTYFEVIAVDPDQPNPGRTRPFDLVPDSPPRLAGYAIHPTGSETLEDVAARMRSAGFDPGKVAEMSRQKPDGELLAWRLTVDTSGVRFGDGALPFAIDWGDSPSPATSLPSMGRLVSLVVSHPDAGVRANAEALGLAIEVTEGPVGLVATVDTANGQVQIS